MDDETEQLFQRLLSERGVENNLTSRERKQLKQPVTRVRADNIFTWHLNWYTVFEDEADPELVKNRIWLRRVGVTEGGRLTDDQIATQEERLGIRLPAPWRNVYKHFNGGWVHTLYWGDMNNPRMNGIEPIPQSSHEYLALEDVAPLRDLLPTEREGLDCSSLDPRLIVKVHRTVTPRAGTLKCLNQLLFPGFSKGHDRLRLVPPQPTLIFAMKSAD